MPGAAEVRWTSTGEGRVGHLSGEIDLANAADVLAAVRAGIEDSRSLLVDLTDVTFIDSRGLAALLELSRTVAMQLVAPPGWEPRRVLDITQLTTVIPTFDTVEAALGSRFGAGVEKGRAGNGGGA